jgi:[ribosomal protein S5]-alanine N-acetyltransferase
MELKKLVIDKLLTERLILIPYTIKICEHILSNDFRDFDGMPFKRGINWPDEDALESLPRILNHLLKVGAPTGYESWMIIKKDTFEVIGDLGFKGFNSGCNNIDIGYGIIKEERRNGYTGEAVETIIKWVFSTEIVDEITANCLIDNTGSINILKKNNFKQIKIENDSIYWSLKLSDFRIKIIT